MRLTYSRSRSATRSSRSPPPEAVFRFRSSGFFTVLALEEAPGREVEAFGVAEGGPELSQSPEEEVRDRVRRTVHPPRHFLEREPLHAGEEDHPPVLRSQEIEGVTEAVEPFPLPQGTARRGAARRVISFERHLWIAAAPSGQVQDDVVGDAPEPGREGFWSLPPEAVDGLERPEEGLLDHVLHLHPLEELLSQP